MVNATFSVISEASKIGKIILISSPFPKQAILLPERFVLVGDTALLQKQTNIITTIEGKSVYFFGAGKMEIQILNSSSQIVVTNKTPAETS